MTLMIASTCYQDIHNLEWLLISLGVGVVFALICSFVRLFFKYTEGVVFGWQLGCFIAILCNGSLEGEFKYWSYIIIGVSMILGLILAWINREQWEVVGTAVNGSIALVIGLALVLGVIQISNFHVMKDRRWTFFFGFCLMVLLFISGVYVQCLWARGEHSKENVEKEDSKDSIDNKEPLVFQEEIKEPNPDINVDGKI